MVTKEEINELRLQKVKLYFYYAGSLFESSEYKLWGTDYINAVDLVSCDGREYRISGTTRVSNLNCFRTKADYFKYRIGQKKQNIEGWKNDIEIAERAIALLTVELLKELSEESNETIR